MLPIERLRQRELDQWQRPRLVGGVRDHGRDEAGLEGDAGALGGAADRLFELVGLQRWDRLRATREQLAEARVHQRAIVEVGAERRDHSDAAVGIGARHADALQEVRAHGLVASSA